MSTTAQKRLKEELKKITKDPPAGVSVEPSDNTVLQWTATIFGPYNTPFENGVFTLTLVFTEQYPLQPPIVTFQNPGGIFHPNVYENGRICLDILQSKWNSTYEVANVLTAIQALLSDPNPDSPANRVAAQLYKTNMPEYEKKVREVISASNS